MDKNKIEYYLLLSISGLFNFLGLNNSRKFAKYLAKFLYYFVPVRRSTIEKNLAIAFPDWEIKRIKETAIKNYESLLITLIEILVLPKYGEKTTENSTYSENMDIVDKEFANNKGIILLTAHFGNWELGGSWFSKSTSHPIKVLAKSQRNPYVTDFLNKTREVFGNKVIMVGAGVKELFRQLRKNEIVGVVGDQRGPREGQRVKFFGRDTALYPGTAAIAVKTDTPIIFCLMCRQPDYKYKFIFEKIEMPDENYSNEKKNLIINQIYMKKLEKYVRQYPEQWFWMHKIWKY